jgi:3-oxoacyl-[acyl-carrier-protein] synthase II
VLFPPATTNPPRNRVVVTGAGIVTALGRGWKANADGFRNGRLAFRPVSLFDVSRQRVRQAAEVSELDNIPSTHLSRRELSRIDRAARLLLIAADEAWASAGWNGEQEFPLVLGTTSGGMSMGEAYFRQATERPSALKGQATRVAQYQPQRQALQLQEALRFSGPITIIANACASGANAIGHAFCLIRDGNAERVFTGGYDALSQLVFAGFDSLQALSPTQCRPFDTRRDGLALGEGAAMLTLERLETAQSRGARILGEIVGYSAATDHHHLTQPHPEGNAALHTMRYACTAAGITPEQIGYVNAHGTGTPLNDSAEAIAINRWAGDAVSRIRVSSTKSSVGHLLGAAGSVEAVVCLMALGGQWLPPTVTIESVDPICRFDIVRAPADAKIDYALSNSFGFGGSNATLVFRRFA